MEGKQSSTIHHQKRYPPPFLLPTHSLINRSSEEACVKDQEDRSSSVLRLQVQSAAVAAEVSLYGSHTLGGIDILRKPNGSQVAAHKAY